MNENKTTKATPKKKETKATWRMVAMKGKKEQKEG
jgi:hypothetical protein